MSLSDLLKYSPGLNDDAGDQTAGTIINIDTGDADGNGLPIDTSEVPEADIAEAQTETVEAVETQEVAEDAGEQIDNLDKVEEALESLHRERRGPTPMEAKLIDDLAAGSTARLYAAATRDQRLSGVYGSGLNSISSADSGMVAAGIEETRKGIMDTLKQFIQKVIEFFKSIGKAVMKWISGSKKLLGRADEIIKRAGETKTSASSEKISLSGSGALAYGGSFSVAAVKKGLSYLNKKTKEVLVEDVLYTNLVVASVEALRKVSGTGDDEFAKIFAAATDKAKAGVVKLQSDGRDSVNLIGGLQVGTIVNKNEYKISAFAKSTNVSETDSLPALSSGDAKAYAQEAKELVQTAIKYQDGWKERDKSRAGWQTDANKIASEAAKEYAKDTDDKIITKFKNKRRMAQSTGATLMSVISVENRLVGHSLKVAKTALDYCDKSIKVLNKEEKKKDDKK